MSNIPDFPNQVLEVEKQLETQIVVTREDWRDEKAAAYCKEHLQQYGEKMQLFLNGGANMVGLGLVELMEFVNRKMEEMAQLTGISVDVQFERAAGGWYNGGKLKDNHDREIDPENADSVRQRGGLLYGDGVGRDYWSPENGAKPGEYTPEEIRGHYEERGDIYKR